MLNKTRLFQGSVVFFQIAALAAERIWATVKFKQYEADRSRAFVVVVAIFLVGFSNLIIHNAVVLESCFEDTVFPRIEP